MSTAPDMHEPWALGPPTTAYTSMVIDALGIPVAEIHGETMRKQIRLARLLIGAPKLLRAAREIADHLQRVGIPSDDEPYVDGLIAAIEAADWGSA